MQVVTNWSARASSRTIAACSAMNVRRDRRLVAAPLEVVGGHRVAVGRPQLVPASDPVRPVHEPPALVEDLDVAVLRAQPVDEALEHAAVVEQLHAGLVVDLVADHGRVVRVAADDLARDPLRVPAKRRMGEVGVLPVPVRNRPAGTALGQHLRVLAHQPRRHRIGRSAENDPDAARVGAVENRREPVELEAAVLGLPCRPHRLADADDRETGLGHEVEIALQPVVGLVLRVVRDPVEHLIRQAPQLLTGAQDPHVDLRQDPSSSAGPPPSRNRSGMLAQTYSLSNAVRQSLTTTSYAMRALT